jgi:Rrf2 family protein
MNLQVSTKLAIFALLELAANPDRQLSVAEIGDKFAASGHHLAKVMHILGRAGLVHSVRGAGGGYQFNGNAKRITLLDIVELFEKRSSVDGNAAAEGRTDAGRVLREILREVDEAAQATLGSITIATALKRMDRPKAGTNRLARSPASHQQPPRR